LTDSGEKFIVASFPVFSTKTRKEATMNLEPVSVESPRVVPSPPSSRRKLTQRAVFDNESCRGSAQTASELLLKQILIEIALEKIAAHGLCGTEHVGPYLMDLYRRNCRPNTIRSRFATIFVFLQYLKAKGRNLLELACREDVCAFIEQEQDRGLKPASVSCRVDALYAFIGFWVEREVLSPDLRNPKEPGRPCGLSRRGCLPGT